jgi:hypothetical protein
MTDWSDGIKNAITVIIIVVIVGIIFGFVYMAMQANQDGQDKLSAQVSSLDEKSYAEYDGTKVSGQKVIAAVQQYQGTETGVIIATARDTGGKNYCAQLTTTTTGTDSKNEITGKSADGTMADITDKTKVTYVRPNAQFKATLIRDTNEQVVGIDFVQYNNDGTLVAYSGKS